MTPEQALDSTVSEVAPLVRSRQLSPVALAEASLERLEAEGRALNAVATVTATRALDDAGRAAGDRGGPLPRSPARDPLWR